VGWAQIKILLTAEHAREVTGQYTEQKARTENETAKSPKQKTFRKRGRSKGRGGVKHPDRGRASSRIAKRWAEPEQQIPKKRLIRGDTVPQGKKKKTWQTLEKEDEEAHKSQKSILSKGNVSAHHEEKKGEVGSRLDCQTPE